MAGPLRADTLRVVQSGVRDEDPSPARTDKPHACAIQITGATLHYPVGPFVRGSLKTSLLQLLGHRKHSEQTDYVDAIKDMNLNIAFGERVGIIGSNGAGKSTLLRAMAGIYPLKHGTIRVVGQIGTLLDIGLGFEVESTGRENIYYRGMSMGYAPAVLRGMEQQIIDFADLGRFIDLPMRTYSSGMYVRLGFAISTQISPDVLLVDEVFGAGDAAFAERALQRISDVVDRAGIVVLATHDMKLVERICTRVIWMKSGEIVRDGPPSVVLPQFHQFMSGNLPI